METKHEKPLLDTPTAIATCLIGLSIPSMTCGYWPFLGLAIVVLSFLLNVPLPKKR